MVSDLRIRPLESITLTLLPAVAPLTVTKPLLNVGTTIILLFVRLSTAWPGSVPPPSQVLTGLAKV